MEEIWKVIEGYENVYEVSSIGRVRSLDRTRINSNGISRTDKGIVLKNVFNIEYLKVFLSNGKSVKQENVHVLVAKAFVENTNNLPEVNHKDHDKLNNVYTNLEWCTRSENMKHAYTNPNRKGFGDNHKATKLSIADIIEILSLLGSDLSQKNIAKLYDIDPTAVSHIKNGTYKSVNYTKFKSIYL